MFLVYMLLMNFVAVAIVLCDFFYVLWKVSVKKHRQRKAKKALQTGKLKMRIALEIIDLDFVNKPTARFCKFNLFLEEMPLAIVDEKPAEE